MPLTNEKRELLVSTHSKLQWHAKKFEESLHPEKIVKKYAVFLESASRAQIKKHLVHIASWVALAKPASKKSLLEAAHLLKKWLSIVENDHQAPRFKFALELVGDRLRDRQLPSKKNDMWTSLREALVRSTATTESRPMKTGPQIHAEASTINVDGSSEICQKSVVKLNRKLAAWANCTFSEQQARIALSRTRLQGLCRDQHVNTISLRSVLYDTVVALSRPHTKSEKADFVQVVAASKHVQTTAQTQDRISQGKIRRTLIEALQLWRISWWLEDDQILPILERIRSLIQDFEIHHGNVEHAAASQEWRKLKELVEIDSSLISHGQDNPGVVHIPQKREDPGKFSRNADRENIGSDKVLRENDLSRWPGKHGLGPGESLEVPSSCKTRRASGTETWTIRHCADGAHSCTCPSWLYQKGVPGYARFCKHTVDEWGADAEAERCQMALTSVRDSRKHRRFSVQ
mmetsp:Transcript_150977/g.289290  ORF Transcript_150977/g.289290 Transcript_150977/m.289290 type:complete len:461 (+) Transcript_150977:13-1395(+)